MSKRKHSKKNDENLADSNKSKKEMKNRNKKLKVLAEFDINRIISNNYLGDEESDESSDSDSDSDECECDESQSETGTECESSSDVEILLESPNESANDDDDDDDDEDDIEYQEAQNVHNLLKNIIGSGKYSVGGEATKIPIANLEINGLKGKLELPLKEPQANELIKLCSQSPFGSKYKTLIDKQVRDTYELDPSQFKLKNTDWNKCLNSLVEKIAQELGCKGQIESKIYKLLLYTKGGHFKKHRDTEKVKNMFGTLILQLPSNHTGGELVVYNGESRSIYDFGQDTGKSAYLMHYAAHYADLEHEVLKVKDGYRLALVYSLCWADGNHKANSHQIINNQSFIKNMSASLDILLNNSNNRFALFLDHKYTPSSFRDNGVKALKGIDLDRFNLLKNASAQLPEEKQLNFYIAHANLVLCEAPNGDGYYNRWYDDEDGDEEYSSGYECPEDDSWYEVYRENSIEEWYDSDGDPFLNGHNVDFSLFSYIINPNLKKTVVDITKEINWGNAKNVENEDYTGNEGPSRTTTYHKYFLVFWSKSDEFNAFLKIDNKTAINILYKQVETNTKNERMFKKYLEDLIDNLKQHYENINYRNKPLNNEYVYKMLKLLEHAKSEKLFRKFLDIKFYKYIDIEYKSSQLLANLIVSFKSSSFKHCFINSIDSMNIQILINYCYLIKDLIIKMRAEKIAIDLLDHLFSKALDNSNDTLKIKLNQQQSNFFFNDLGSKLNDIILVCYTLAETFLLFSTPQEDYLKKLKTLIIQLLKPDQIKQLLKEFQNKFEFFIRSESIQSLFDYRFNMLQAKLDSMPEFNWRMTPRVSIIEHPRFEEFLRSDRKEMHYTGVFTGIQEARKFVTKYGKTDKITNGYSVVMEASGVGKSSKVTIEKTKIYYDLQVYELRQDRQEYNELKKLLKKV